MTNRDGILHSLKFSVTGRGYSLIISEHAWVYCLIVCTVVVADYKSGLVQEFSNVLFILYTFFLNAGIPENKNYIYNNLGIVNNIVYAQMKVVCIKSKKVTI